MIEAELLKLWWSGQWICEDWKDLWTVTIQVKGRESSELRKPIVNNIVVLSAFSIEWSTWLVSEGDQRFALLI